MDAEQKSAKVRRWLKEVDELSRSVGVASRFKVDELEVCRILPGKMCDEPG